MRPMRDPMLTVREELAEISAHLNEWPCAGGFAALHRLNGMLGFTASPPLLRPVPASDHAQIE
jgi:hypothetical protein